MAKSKPIEYISINNLSETENIHIDMDEAIVNDGKIIEARTRRLYCLAEFIRLH
jgi:hypothetical protein